MRYIAASFLILTQIQKSNHLRKTNTDQDVKQMQKCSNHFDMISLVVFNA